VSDPARREQEVREALALFEQAVVRLRNADARGSLANALFGRGQARDALRQYSAAIKDFDEANQLGHSNAASWRWWATDGLAAQMRDQGKTVPALLMAALNALDLTPELKGKISA
jgi:tetratricopeptide (TPR) repeat protein